MKHRLDSFVHVFRKFSESNWKFSPVVRFGASVALWCVNATVGHPCYYNLKIFHKRVFIQNFLCLSFSPFCVLYIVRYNKTNMTSLCGVQQELFQLYTTQGCHICIIVLGLKLLSWPLVTRVGTKQNAAKEEPTANCVKSPDLGWLNVDRYGNVIDAKALIGPCSHVTLRCCLNWYSWQESSM